MALKAMYSGLRHMVQKFGFELHRFPQPGTLASYLRNYGIETVLDVGANIGQYGIELRRDGYKGKIISFEPLSKEFGILSGQAKKDRNWVCFNNALGEAKGTAAINVSEFSVFSSFLPINELGVSVDSTSKSTRKEEVKVERLDDLLPTLPMEGKTWMLKIDTQGFEIPVLRGAAGSLSKFAVLQLELSLRNIYDGQPKYYEIVDRLRENGFALSGMSRVLSSQGDELLELDGFFVRKSAAQG